MMKTTYHFMATLGNGRYSESTYVWPGGSGHKTKYVQVAALLKMVEDIQKESKTEDDALAEVKVSIFLTADARKTHWEALKEEIEAIWQELSEEYDFLCDFPEISGIDIPDGNDEAELNTIFETMFQAIRNGEEVYFDVTHGFRVLPMLALAVINYARPIKNIGIGAITYGAFNMKHPETTSLLDLTYCSRIMEWTGASEAFLAYEGTSRIGANSGIPWHGLED